MNLNIKKITLAANWQTYCELKERAIKSMLWEDCYEEDDLLLLHKKFKNFSYYWYKDKDSNDLSIYDGLSIGNCIAYLLYYDLETWIRVFFLFEYLAINKISSNFYVLNKEYFPDNVYQFTDRLNEIYGTYLNIIFLDQEDDGIEYTVKRTLSFNRNLVPIAKCRFANLINFVERIRSRLIPQLNTDVKCLVIGIRDTLVYLNLLNKDKNLNHKITVYFDYHYVDLRVLLKTMRYKNVRIIGVEDYDLENKKFDAYISKLLEVSEERLNQIDFLNKIGRDFFRAIFKEYIGKSLIAQLKQYSYLKNIIGKREINTTICGGHDSPESYYCKHLMDKIGGKAYLLPHGLVIKDSNDFKYREALAHYYFAYSANEKETWLNSYEIAEENILPIRFL